MWIIAVLDWVDILMEIPLVALGALAFWFVVVLVVSALMPRAAKPHKQS